MGKRHPDLPAWQWRSEPHRHNPTQQVLSLIAVPLLVVACLLLASAAFSQNLPGAVIGLMTLLAGLGLQYQGRQLEIQASDTDHQQTF